MPGIKIFRPADAVETAECWALALASEQPSLLALSRQNLKRRGPRRPRKTCPRAAPTSSSPAGEPRKVILIARFRSRVGAGGRGQARGQGSAPMSSRCRAPNRSMARTPRIAKRSSRRFQHAIAGVDRGRHDLWLGTLHRPAWPSHRHRRVWGLGTGQGRLGLFRADADKSPRAHRVMKQRKTRMTKVAINGFGRIGRLVARAILERPIAGSSWCRSTTLPTPNPTPGCLSTTAFTASFPARSKPTATRSSSTASTST